MFPAILSTLCLDTVLGSGDGSDEAGFVPPPEGSKMPPPPPKSISSSETFAACCCCPVTTVSKSEAKKPPRPPVMFTKIKTDRLSDWAATPNDVNNLLLKMKGMIDVNYIMESKPLGEVDGNPENNPILYRSGHYRFSFTDEERIKLRKFMLDGGMLILNTGLGSLPFYNSAKEELKKIFPEYDLQRLSSDHAIFHSYYDVDRVKVRKGASKTGYVGNEPWFDGITINCRTVAVISRLCMAVGWEENENEEYQAYESGDAQKLGVNLFAYAIASRAWSKQYSSKVRFVDMNNFKSDKASISQVVYDGEWKTRHSSLSMLLQGFNIKTEVPVKFGLSEVRLFDSKLFDSPLIYITGHENFQLKKEEAIKLRQYVMNGGFVLAEACCGRKGFDLSFRKVMREIFPENPMKGIPLNSTLYGIPNKIGKVGVTSLLAGQVGEQVDVQLEGVEVEGKYGVIYSKFGLSGGWEMGSSPYSMGYSDNDAIRIGQNILMYCVSQ